MKKILVTGAGGFIGSHLSRYFFKKGYFVRAVDIKWDDFIEGRYYTEKITLDLREYNNCLKACNGMDSVFNLAANMGGIGYITSVHAEVARDNFLINAHMLEAAKNTEINRILFSSSACVYPNYLQTEENVVALKEEDAIPADANKPYGWEKLFAEILYKAYEKDYGTDIRIVRFHNVYGIGTYKDGREKAPAALCRKVAEAKLTGKNNIVVWGDGKQTRSFMYIDDCCKGLHMIFELNYSNPINLGRDRLIAIDDLAKLVMKIAGVKLNIIHDLSKPQGVRGRNSDNTLCKKLLNWSPQVSLEEGLVPTYNWIEKQVEKDLKEEVNG